MTAAVDRHIALLDAAIEAHGGIHYKTVGDAVQAATGFTGVLDDQQVAPIVTALRTALGEEALAVAWGTGRRLSWADATANALALVNELTPRDEPGNVV